MANMWLNILMPFKLDLTDIDKRALNLQRISYSFISQTLLIAPEFRG